MRYVNLGKSGLKVSRIALGCMSYNIHPREWFLDEATSRPFIRLALELGINFFDTSNMYGGGQSEEVLGRAIRDFANRDDVVIATKAYFPMRPTPNGRGLSRKALFTEVDHSLRRLGTDYIDLYQIHRYDPETPIEETLEALDDIVRAGKVRYLGASSMFAWQLCRALYLADLKHWTRFASVQPHYNLIHREEEREMLPLCAAEGIGVVPWSPLARGRLSRAWDERSSTSRGQTDEFQRSLYDATQDADRKIIDVVGKLATERELSRSQISLAWLLHKPVVTAPIIGATREHHLREALASTEVKLSAAEINALEAPYVPHRIVGYE